MSYWNLFNLPLSIIQNAFNASYQAKQNKHNEKLVDMQNKAAEKQAEKAYIRSLPSNQMQNMRSAGISDFAAAQAISGGGTYQPAPVNTSQGQAPQIDLNGAMQAITNSLQMKQEMKMQDKLLAAQKAENAANRETQKEIAQLQADTTNRNADNRLTYDYENARRNWRLIDSQISHIEKQTESLSSIINGQELDNERKRLENDNYPELAKLTNKKAFQEIEALILECNQSRETHEQEIRNKKLENRFLEFTEKYRVDAENARNELMSYMDSVHLNVNTPAAGLLACLELLMNVYFPKVVK